MSDAPRFEKWKYRAVIMAYAVIIGLLLSVVVP